MIIRLNEILRARWLILLLAFFALWPSIVLAQSSNRCSLIDRGPANIGKVAFSDADPVGKAVRVSGSTTVGMVCLPVSGAMQVQLSERYRIPLTKYKDGIWETGVKGIGVRITPGIYSGGTYVVNTALTTKTSASIYLVQQSTAASAVSEYWWGGIYRSQLELVKTNTEMAPSGTYTVKLADKEMNNVWYSGAAGTGVLVSTGEWRDVGDMRITFTIENTAATCSFQADTVTFPLNNVEASSLPSVGSQSPWVSKPLVSAGCPNAKNVWMRFQGTPDATNPALFSTTGGASGVGVEMQSADGYAVVPNGTTPMNWQPRAAGGEFGFKARYVRTTAPITPGAANSTITVNLSYD